MPHDKAGKFHLNTQRAMASDKMANEPEKPKSAGAALEEPEHSSVHEHLSALHAEHGGKHMHVHHDGMSITSHHVGEDGEVQGPHNHENIEALKEHLGKFFDEEANEWKGEDYGHAGSAHKSGGY